MTTQQDSVDVERQWLTTLQRSAAKQAVICAKLANETPVAGEPDPLWWDRQSAIREAAVILAHVVALTLPITQRDEQAKTYADGVEDAARYVEGHGGVIPGATAFIPMVTGDRMPCMSGDGRDRLMPARRREFDDATRSLAAAIRRLSIEQGDQDGGRDQLGDYPLEPMPGVAPIFVRQMMLQAMAAVYAKATGEPLHDMMDAARATWDTEWETDPLPRTFKAAEEAAASDLEHWEAD